MLSAILQVLDCCLSFVAGTVPTLATCNCPPLVQHALRSMQHATPAMQRRRRGRPYRYDHVGSAAQRQSRCNCNRYNTTIGNRRCDRSAARHGAAALSHSCGRDWASMGCGPPPAAAMPCLAVQSEEWENGDAGGFVCYMADEVGAHIHDIPHRMVSRAAWYPARRGSAAHATCNMFGS